MDSGWHQLHFSINLVVMPCVAFWPTIGKIPFVQKLLVFITTEVPLAFRQFYKAIGIGLIEPHGDGREVRVPGFGIDGDNVVQQSELAGDVPNTTLLAHGHVGQMLGP